MKALNYRLETIIINIVISFIMHFDGKNNFQFIMSVKIISNAFLL